jgi:hypothetical protein
MPKSAHPPQIAKRSVPAAMVAVTTSRGGRNGKYGGEEKIAAKGHCQIPLRTLDVADLASAYSQLMGRGKGFSLIKRWKVVRGCAWSVVQADQPKTIARSAESCSGHWLFVDAQGVGLQGNSHAISTKDERIRTLPLETIKGCVDEFKEFARQHPDLKFQVTAIGCGLAGYKPQQMASMFADALPNCVLTPEFVAVGRGR